MEKGKLKLKKPTKAGYTFLGWYSDKYFTSKKLSKVGGKTAEKVTVYAKWAKNPKTKSQKRVVSLAKAAYKNLIGEECTTRTKVINALQRGGFSAFDAKFAADNCGANYYAQAIKVVKYAKNLPGMENADRQILKDYLTDLMLDEGFTKGQINYAFKVTKF